MVVRRISIRKGSVVRKSSKGSSKLALKEKAAESKLDALETKLNKQATLLNRKQNLKDKQKQIRQLRIQTNPFLRVGRKAAFGAGHGLGAAIRAGSAAAKKKGKKKGGFNITWD